MFSPSGSTCRGVRRCAPRARRAVSALTDVIPITQAPTARRVRGRRSVGVWTNCRNNRKPTGQSARRRFFVSGRDHLCLQLHYERRLRAGHGQLTRPVSRRRFCDGRWQPAERSSRPPPPASFYGRALSGFIYCFSVAVRRKRAWEQRPNFELYSRWSSRMFRGVRRPQ